MTAPIYIVSEEGLIIPREHDLLRNWSKDPKHLYRPHLEQQLGDINILWSDSYDDAPEHAKTLRFRGDSLGRPLPSYAERFFETSSVYEFANEDKLEEEDPETEAHIEHSVRFPAVLNELKGNTTATHIIENCLYRTVETPELEQEPASGAYATFLGLACAFFLCFEQCFDDAVMGVCGFFFYIEQCIKQYIASAISGVRGFFAILAMGVCGFFITLAVIGEFCFWGVVESIKSSTCFIVGLPFKCVMAVLLASIWCIKKSFLIVASGICGVLRGAFICFRGILKFSRRLVRSKVAATAMLLWFARPSAFAIKSAITIILLGVACKFVLATSALAARGLKKCSVAVISCLGSVSKSFWRVATVSMLWVITMLSKASVVAASFLKKSITIAISSIRGCVYILPAIAIDYVRSYSRANPPLRDSCLDTSLLHSCHVKIEDWQIPDFATPPLIFFERKPATEDDVDFHQAHDDIAEDIVEEPLIVQEPKKKGKKRMCRALESTLDGKAWAVSGRARRSTRSNGTS